MPDFAAVYVETYEHIVPILGDLSEEQLGLRVPFSPEWSVRDVIAHVAAEAHQFTSGEEITSEVTMLGLGDRGARLAAIDAMNAHQIAARVHLSLGELLAQWDADLPVLVAQLRGERPFPGDLASVSYVAAIDLGMHAQDIRNLIGKRGDRESAGVGLALPMYSGLTAMRIAELGLPALAIEYGEKRRVLGEGAVGATVRAERYELVRAFSNRRSRQQIEGYEWEGDPTPYLALIPAYAERHDPILDD